MPVEDPDNPQNLQPRPPQPPPLYAAGSRYSDLATHELWQLLDDMDDERARARRREAFYLSTIVYLLLAWFVFYGPSVLWHQPHMINPADVLKTRDLTYLDLPPDALKQLKPKTPPKALSDRDRVEQTVKPLDKKTLQHLQEQEPPPAPTPQPAQQAQLPPSPQPQQPPPMHPQPNQSILDAPRPQPSKPSFNQPSRSVGDNLQRLAENALPTRPGFGAGRYGDTGVPHHSGLQAPVEVLSDTTGVDENQLNAYLKRLLHDVKQTWLPLIPEEAQPPLLKQGETVIRFTIAPDGKVIGMQLVDSTHDNALNRAAWGSITGTSFGTLPRGMKDPNLTLLIRYMVNEPLE
ncbi:MAG: TonB family protein [Acidobacteriaceae bacterium]|nr:TonB family protein [Acidobacteriaceae bacterium]